MTRTLSLIALLFLLTAAFPTPAAAQGDVTCPGTSYDEKGDPPSQEILGHWRTYLSADHAWGDPRANVAGQIRLRGWVFIPRGAPPKGGFPVLIFNHGSGQEADPRCELAEWFVPRDYIMFMPMRRGHEGSTGIYFDDYADAQVDTACMGELLCTDTMRKKLKRMYTMEYLRDQGDDVTSAINYIRNTYPKANPNNVAVIGHSFGAMTSLLWNMREGPNTKVVISISAGAQSWGDANDDDDYLQWALKDAVRNAKRPIYFLAPLNDKSTLPMAELPHVAGHEEMRWQAAIFSKVPEALLTDCPRPDEDDPDKEITCRDVAHGKFVRVPSQVKLWAPSVAEFLRRFGVK